MSDSYSQHGEDRIISAYLDRCQLESGMILDIGAWDPIDKSNSRLFIERGWTAILIDPSPMAVRNLAKAYEKNDRVIVISAAVAFEHELAKVRITDDAVSTTEQKQAETWKDEGGYYG